MSQLNFFMAKEEIKEQLKVLFSSGHFSLFQGQFFDIQSPDPICNLDKLEGLTI